MIANEKIWTTSKHTTTATTNMVLQILAGEMR